MKNRQQNYPPSARRINTLITERDIRRNKDGQSYIRDLLDAKTALLNGLVHTKKLFDVGYMVVNIDYILKNL